MNLDDTLPLPPTPAGALPFPLEPMVPSPRVLVLESEAGPQQNLSHVLRREGFVPVTCATSAEAVGLLRREPFTVAVIGKPEDETSWENLLREAQAHAGWLRVILLAAADSPQADNFRDYLDAVVCLGRPYDPTQLISQVHWTFHHHLQQALSSVSHFQRRITETVPEHIYVYDIAEARMVYSNRKLHEILGYGEEELGRMGDGFPVDLFHPDDRAEFERTLEGYDRLDDAQVISIKCRLRHKSGEWRWLLIRSVLFSHEFGGRARRILGVLEDITESERAGEALRASREELRQLARHLQSVREKERSDIAREVHDRLGQTLTAMKLQLAWFETSHFDLPEMVSHRLEVLSQLVDSTVETVRRIARELRPQVVEDLGLVAAMRWQVEEFAARSGLDCRFTTDFEQIDLPAEHSTHLFRILQESLTNVARHARAGRVEISLTERDEGLDLVIADDGRGITAEEIASTRSIGLIGMRERVLLCGGAIEFVGEPEDGTRVLARIPYSPISSDPPSR